MRIVAGACPATLASLRRLLCHSSTEKTSKVLKQAGIETGEKKEVLDAHPPIGARAGLSRRSAAEPASGCVRPASTSRS